MEIIDFNDRREYIGLASEMADLPTDEKDCDCGSMFYAVDTRNIYIFYEGTWHRMNNQ